MVGVRLTVYYVCFIKQIFFNKNEESLKTKFFGNIQKKEIVK